MTNENEGQRRRLWYQGGTHLALHILLGDKRQVPALMTRVRTCGVTGMASQTTHYSQ